MQKIASFIMALVLLGTSFPPLSSHAQTFPSALSNKQSLLELHQNSKTKLTAAQEKLSSDLIQKVNPFLLEPVELQIEAIPNSEQDQPIISQRVVAPLRTIETVYVYIELSAGTSTSLVDDFVDAVVNRDEENHLVSARISSSRLETLSSQHFVQSVQTVIEPVVNSGSVLSQGDRIHNSDQARASFGADGSGIKIGVISDGVDGLNQAQATGDVPNVSVLSNLQGGSEGVAMLEIIHDLAPGAELLFHDHGGDVIGFMQGIDNLVAQGADIIVDDISWIAEPFFEDGDIAQHVQGTLDRNNIIYISSAGNAGESHHQSRFYDDGTACHDFSRGRGTPTTMTLFPGTAVIIIAQWNERFGSASNDYDLFLSETTLGDLSFSTSANDSTGNPIEFIYYENGSSTTTAALDICKYAATGNEIMETYIYLLGPGFISQDNMSPADAVFGHAAVPDAIAVGAVPASSITTIESFSSQGPVTILGEGTRRKPDVVAVDGVRVTGAGGFPSQFFGTSAAAPHVAAIAAQVWSHQPELSGDEIRSYITSSATDLGTRGRDNTYGHGRADALAALSALPQPTPEPPAPEPVPEPIPEPPQPTPELPTPEPEPVPEPPVPVPTPEPEPPVPIPTPEPEPPQPTPEPEPEPDPEPVPEPTPDPSPAPQPDLPIILSVADDNVINAQEADHITVTGLADALVPLAIAISDSQSNMINGTTLTNTEGELSITVNGQSAFPGPLTDGELLVIVNAGGNLATKKSFQDTIAPPQPSIISVADDDIIDSDEFNSIVVTGKAEDNSTMTITLSDGSNSVSESGAARNGRFSIILDGSLAQPSALQEGLNGLSATAISTDLAGNRSEPSTRNATLDRSSPETPTIDPVAEDNIINAAELSAIIISGTASSGSAIDVILSNEDRELTANTKATEGRYRVVIDGMPEGEAFFADGSKHLQLTVTSSFENGLSRTSSQTISQDTIIETPTITSVAKDDVINALESSTVIIAGESEANATIMASLHDGETFMSASGTADITGSYTVIVSSEFINNGEATAFITAVDLAGNTSSEVSRRVTKDTLLPPAPTLTSIAGNNTIESHEVENVDILGNSIANGEVTITLSDGFQTLRDTTTASSDGSFGFSLNAAALRDGDKHITVSVSVTNSIGNTSPQAQYLVSKTSIQNTTVQDSGSTGSSSGGGGGRRRRNPGTTTNDPDQPQVIKGRFQASASALIPQGKQKTAQITNAGTLTITALQNTNYKLVIPAYTSIVGSQQWSGDINAPEVAQASIIPSKGGKIINTDKKLQRNDVDVVIRAGSEDSPLSFSNPIEVFVPSKFKDDDRITIYHSNDAKHWEKLTSTLVNNGSIHFATDQLSYFAFEFAGEQLPIEAITNTLSELQDIKGHWAFAYIKELVESGIASGKRKGEFAPNEDLTRAELVKITLNAFEIDVPEQVLSDPYQDVSALDWFAPYLQTAKELGIISADQPLFRPNDLINRAEALKILLLAAEVDTSRTRIVRFSDMKRNDWFAPYISFAAANGIATGYEDGSFKPFHVISRGVIAKMVVILKQSITEQELLQGLSRTD